MTHDDDTQLISNVQYMALIPICCVRNRSLIVFRKDVILKCGILNVIYIQPCI